jgi:hypothetical protein
MPKYKITYEDEHGEPQSKEIEVKNDEWADGTAYGITDKGPYKVYVTVTRPNKSVIESAPVREYWQFAFDSYTSTNRKFKLVDGFYKPI